MKLGRFTLVVIAFSAMLLLARGESERTLCGNTASTCLLSTSAVCEDPEECPERELYTIIIFPLLAVSVGIFLQILQPFLKLQYTLLLLLAGAILGVIGCSADVALLSISLQQWVHLNPAVFFHWFLAPLIFESSFNADWFVFRKLFWQIMFAAFPVVMVQTGIVAAFQKLVIRSPGWDWWASLMFGAMLSATDPIAVTATLKAVGASESLSMLVEGESQLNDGSAYTLWEAFFENVVEDGALSIGDIVVNIIRLSLGGVAMGLAFGLVAVFLLSIVFEMFEVEVSVTLITAFLGFWTAQSPSKLSGVICNVTSGLVLSYAGKPFITPRVRDPLSHIWELLSWLANTVVFFYAGLLVVSFIWSCQGDPLEWYDYVYILAYYAVLQVLRFILVFASYPVFKWKQRWFNWQNAVVLSSAGLRGAVSLILALEVGSTLTVDSQISSRVVVWTAGVVALTLLVNGLLIKPLLHILALDRPDAVRSELLSGAKGIMLQRTFDVLDHFATDNAFKGCDWKFAVQRIVPETWVDDLEKAANDFARCASQNPRSVSHLLSKHSRRSVASVLSELEHGMGSSELVRAIDEATVPLFSKSALASERLDNGGTLASALPRRARASTIYETLNHASNLVRGNSELHIGSGIDVEIRRRYFQALLARLRASYETSLVQFRAMQMLSDDVKTALEENEAEESYELFDFVTRSPKTKAFGTVFARYDLETKIILLSAIQSGVGSVLQEPFMQHSELVFREAESVYESASLFLEQLEWLDPTTFSLVRTTAAISHAFQLQEQTLLRMKTGGFIDESEYDSIRADVVSCQRKFETFTNNLKTRHRFRKLPDKFDGVVVVRNHPLFRTLTDDEFEQMFTSYGQIVQVSGNEPIEADGAGLLLVVTGNVKAQCESLFVKPHCRCVWCSNDDSVSEQTLTTAPTPIQTDSSRQNVTKGGNAPIEVFVGEENLSHRQSVLQMRTSASRFHWCLPSSSVLVNSRLVGLEPGGFPPLSGCHAVSKHSIVFVLPYGECERLMDSSPDFATEIARQFAHKVTLEHMKNESPYVLHTLQSYDPDHESKSTPATRAAWILHSLDYMERVVVTENQIVLMTGPAVLLRGVLQVSILDESTQNREVVKYVGPCTLPHGNLSVEVDTVSNQDQTANLLVEPARTAEETALKALLRWNLANQSLQSNGRFGAYRHISAQKK